MNKEKFIKKFTSKVNSQFKEYLNDWEDVLNDLPDGLKEPTICYDLDKHHLLSWLEWTIKLDKNTKVYIITGQANSPKNVEVRKQYAYYLTEYYLFFTFKEFMEKKPELFKKITK